MDERLSIEDLRESGMIEEQYIGSGGKTSGEAFLQFYKTLSQDFKLNSLSELKTLVESKVKVAPETNKSVEQPKIHQGLIEMVEVEGGTFMMGATPEQGEGAYDSENPSHEVTIDSYYIGKYPITQEEWESVMGNNPSGFPGKIRPVSNISWYDAVEFCNRISEREGLSPAYRIDKGKKDPYNMNYDDDKKWTVSCDFSLNGYRLPTEAEWEYAARGGNKSKGYKYSGSNEMKEAGCFGAYNNSGNRTIDERTSEVGLKLGNELGIHDMSGNVFEWCWDWYGPYTSMSKTNPKGVKSGVLRVFRGGNSWPFFADYCRVTYRNDFHPVYRFNFALGFRVARTKS